eukprot:2264155-Amphidinium_carterae.1
MTTLEVRRTRMTRVSSPAYRWVSPAIPGSANGLGGELGEFGESVSSTGASYYAKRFPQVWA